MLLAVNGLKSKHLYAHNPPNIFYTNQNQYNIWIISPKRIFPTQIHFMKILFIYSISWLIRESNHGLSDKEPVVSLSVQKSGIQCLQRW